MKLLIQPPINQLISRLIANYAAPIFAQLKPTKWQHLQRAHNASLMAMAGCYTITVLFMNTKV